MLAGSQLDASESSPAEGVRDRRGRGTVWRRANAAPRDQDCACANARTPSGSKELSCRTATDFDAVRKATVSTDPYGAFSAASWASSSAPVATRALPLRLDDAAEVSRSRTPWKATEAHTSTVMTSGAILRARANTVAPYNAGDDQASPRWDFVIRVRDRDKLPDRAPFADLARADHPCAVGRGPQRGRSASRSTRDRTLTGNFGAPVARSRNGCGHACPLSRQPITNRNVRRRIRGLTFRDPGGAVPMASCP